MTLPRPAGGPRKRWKDMIRQDIQSLDLHDWAIISLSRHAWYTAYTSSLLARQAAALAPTREVMCCVCERRFGRVSDRTRHKCLPERQRPVSEQRGAVRCPHCDRWFASRGGLAVHRCAPDADAPLPTPLPPDRVALQATCCRFHCSACARCLKSKAGFRRHICRR